jgi:hypothetical protein
MEINNNNNISRCKRYPVTGPKAQRGSRGTALLFPDLGARRRWVHKQMY